MTTTDRMQRRRRLWALLTAEPRATYQAIAARLGYRSINTVHGDMRALVAAGYVTDGGRGYGTRRVLVPLVEA